LIVSESAQKSIEQFREEQAKLEELLFLVDRERRPRVQKMLAQLRAQIAALDATQTQPEISAPKSLTELRQRQTELEETLFLEPPERRPQIKKLLAQVRAEIAVALENSTPEDAAKTTNTGGPPQVA
jgi:hypothetical protein